MNSRIARLTLGLAVLVSAAACGGSPRLAENFEGVQQWALGVQGNASLRVYELSEPSRLVVDVSG